MNTKMTNDCSQQKSVKAELFCNHKNLKSLSEKYENKHMME